MKHINWVLLSVFLMFTHASFAKDSTAFSGANGKPFQYLQQQIDAMNNNDELVAELTARLNALEENMRTLQNQIDSSVGDIDSLRSEMDVLLEEVDMVEANLMSLQQTLNEGCPTGYTLRRITEAGTVLCETSAGDSNGEISLFLLSRSSTVHVSAGSAVSSSQATVSAICPSGYLATGGGYMTVASPNLTVVQSFPYSSTGWTGHVVSKDPAMQPFTVFVKCARLL